MIVEGGDSVGVQFRGKGYERVPTWNYGITHNTLLQESLLQNNCPMHIHQGSMGILLLLWLQRQCQTWQQDPQEQEAWSCWYGYILSQSRHGADKQPRLGCLSFDPQVTIDNLGQLVFFIDINNTPYIDPQCKTGSLPTISCSHTPQTTVSPALSTPVLSSMSVEL